jgi:hypothetical protein
LYFSVYLSLVSAQYTTSDQKQNSFVIIVQTNKTKHNFLSLVFSSPHYSVIQEHSVSWGHQSFAQIDRQAKREAVAEGRRWDENKRRTGI